MAEIENHLFSAVVIKLLNGRTKLTVAGPKTHIFYI